MTCRERLVIIKFRFARDYKSAVPVQKMFSERWSSKSVSAVVIKFMSLRCTCAINSAAKPIDQLRKYSAAYPAQKKDCQNIAHPFFRASWQDKTLAAERFLTFAPQKNLS